MSHTTSELIDALRERGATIACAESLTGGLLTSRLIDTPGASDVVRGGIVAYASELKASLLGVEDVVLRLQGPVSGQCALQMAEGVRARCGAAIGLATTGVAGPGPDEDAPGGPIPAGTVLVGISAPAGRSVRSHAFEGDRAAVRELAVDAALDLLAEVIFSS